MTTLTLQPLIPTSLWLTLAVGAAALLAWYARGRPAVISRGRWFAIVGLMSCCFAAVLTVLLNPTWVRPIPPPVGKPLLTVLIDSTESMATPDAGGKSRFQTAAVLASSLAQKLNDQFDVRVMTFADSVAPVDATKLVSTAPHGQTTDLAAAISAGLEADRPQGQALMLLSDGIHNAGGGAGPVLAAARLAKSMAAPVYTRTFGGDSGGFDLGVQVRSPQELSFVGQVTPIVATLSHPGLPGGRATVALLRDGREIERKEVTFSPAGPAEVRFEARQESPGLYQYEVRVEPLPGELTDANNSSTFQLRVIDEPIRILLVEGKPYWDGKFLTRTLSADAAVELQSVVKVAAGRLLVRTIPRPAIEPSTRPAAGLPAPAAAASQPTEKWRIDKDAAAVLGSAEALKPFQVIVLGRDAEEFLSDAAVANLRNWIARDGGSLVCYRGSPVAQVNQSLARLMPVKWTPVRESRFHLKFTGPGDDLQWLPGSGDERMAQLPSLATAAHVDQSKPLAIILATALVAGGEASPAVSYQPYGSGRVVAIEGAGMWRWAFLSPQQQEAQGGENVYGDLWRNLLRWLASNARLLPGQKLALRGDKVSFGTGESISATMLIRSEPGKSPVPGITLTGGASSSTKPSEPRQFAATPSGDDPGSFRVNFGKLAPGRYEAQVTGGDPKDPASRIVFDVRSFGEEQLDLRARPDLMARIAIESGGAVLESDSGGDLAKRFLADLHRSRPERVERITAWDNTWVLAGIFGLWAATWALRRSSGLV